MKMIYHRLSAMQTFGRPSFGAAWIRTFTDDPRGPRFVVRGLARGHLDEIEVVCRFLPSGRMRIITAYRVGT